MKVLRMTFVTVLLCLLVVATSQAATISPEDTITKQIKVNLSNDNELSTVCFDITPFPTSILLHDPNKTIDFNPLVNRMVIYGMAKDTPIASGLLLTLGYDNVSVNTVIEIVARDGADVLAEGVIVEGGSGEITLSFPFDDINATAMAVVSLDPTVGIARDLAEPFGIIDSIDLQEIINRQ